MNVFAKKSRKIIVHARDDIESFIISAYEKADLYYIESVSSLDMDMLCDVGEEFQLALIDVSLIKDRMEEACKLVGNAKTPVVLLVSEGDVEATEKLMMEGAFDWVSVEGMKLSKKLFQLKIEKFVSEMLSLSAVFENGRKKFESLYNTEKLLLKFNDWLWRSNVDGEIEYVSGRFEEIFRMNANDYIGKKLWSPISKIEQKRIKTVWKRRIADHKPVNNLKSYIIEPSGEIIYFLISGVPVFDSQGNLRGYQGVGNDLTEKTVNEKATLKNINRYKELVDNFTGGIGVVDSQGRILVSNRKFRSYLDIESFRESKKASLLDNERCVKLGVGEHLVKIFELNYADTIGYEKKITTDDGDEWYGLRFCPFKSKDNKVVEVQVIVKELTSVRRTQQLLLKSKELETIHALATTYSHEINNPLQVALANIQMSRTDDNSFDDVMMSLEKIQKILVKINKLHSEEDVKYRKYATKTAKLLKLK